MEPEKKRIRGCNYTANERTLLLNIVKEYQFIIHSKKLDQTMLNRKAAAWKRITDKFNAISCPNKVNRTEESLRKFYGYARKKIRDEEEVNVMEDELVAHSTLDLNSKFNTELENPFEIDTARLSDESSDLLENINQINKELDSMHTQPDRRRHRSSNYTVNERMLLLNIIKEFQDIIHNKKTDHATIKIKSETWTKIVNKFNAVSWPNKILRTEESLKKFYENIKKKVRKEETDSLQEFGEDVSSLSFNLTSVKSEDVAVISEESNQSIEINNFEPDCNYYAVNEKILLLNIIKEYQHIIDNEDTDQTVAWNTITHKFNAIYWPNKIVRTINSLRMFYENIKTEEADNEKREECSIYPEEQVCDTVVPEESNELHKKTDEILQQYPDFLSNKRTTYNKQKNVVGLKIELYQLKKKSIMLDNEIKQEQLRQERIKTQILELDLKKALEK